MNVAPDVSVIKKLDKTNFTDLNGSYFNGQKAVYGKLEHFPYPNEDDNIQSLVDALFIFYPEEGNHSVDVQLNFESKKLCLISVTKDNQELFSKKLRGRFKKGYFYLRPRFYLVPFFPVLYVHNFERTRIGLTVENHLVVDYSKKMWGFALIAGGSTNGRTTSLHNEKK